MAEPRNGPLLRIVGSCHECSHWQNHRWHNTCGHPESNGAKVDGSTTPTWCPLLPEARRALGLLPPTFSERLAEALYASDNGNGSGALHALLEEVGGVPYDPEKDPRYNGTGAPAMTRVRIPAPDIEADVSAEQLAAYARAPHMPAALRDRLIDAFRTFNRREIVAWICARAEEEGRHPSAVLADLVGPAAGVDGVCVRGDGR